MIKKCLWCYSLLRKSPVNKYCNTQCQNDYQYMNAFLDWYLCGQNKVTNSMLRKHLETINGHICSRCRITEWNSKPIVFDVEHKNGNSTNNSPENVCLLCPNCHSLTDSYANSTSKIGRWSLTQKGLKK